MLPTFVYAGTLVQYWCRKCNFKSEVLKEGPSEGGLVYAAVFCPDCGKFYSMTVGRKGDSPLLAPGQVVRKKPLGKKEFLGKTFEYYACPVCKANAYVYDHYICPFCKEHKFKREIVGYGS